MTSRFDVELSPSNCSLQRILGVVRRRGFCVLAMNAVRAVTGDAYQVELTVDGDRSASTLRHHLENLADVRAVTLLTRVHASCA